MDAELTLRLDRIEELTRLASKNVLSIREASLLLGRSEKTIRNRLKEIPHYYGGTGLAFKRADLEAWQCRDKFEPIEL